VNTVAKKVKPKNVEGRVMAKCGTVQWTAKPPIGNRYISMRVAKVLFKNTF
jgi:hypothetical protein